MSGGYDRGMWRSGCLGLAVVVIAWSAGAARGGEWADWERYRSLMVHPGLRIKSSDLQRARENTQRYEWARKYVAELRASADGDLMRLTEPFVAAMLEQTTPGTVEFTPCPSCREMGKAWHPHGEWDWNVDRPKELKCKVCGMVYPNEKYPETVTMELKWGKGQTISFYGGEPFKVFSYENGRPSFTGNIRARKVAWMGEACARLAEAYTLSGEARYADGVRKILLRMAEVYPGWVVHCGYGEYADMDPRAAAKSVNALAVDEKIYPPNKSDRVLHTGYWQAGRATGNGQEGVFVRKLAEAYDLTCEAKDAAGMTVFSDEERKRIEQKVLLEGTILLTADEKINNKSIGNRSAVAMVGMVVGEPKLVRFGLEGFNRAMHEWFLSDGGTPESASYAMMAFGGLSDLVVAMRGYSDPAGYRDEQGRRLDGVNLFNDPAYARAWGAMIDGLQGDLTLPPFADTRVNSRIDAGWAELLASNYPQRRQYLALLGELCGPDFLEHVKAGVALYYRRPGLETREAGTFVLPDVCLPELRIGEMRTGADGRESLLAVSASHWGGHHHLDSLNLYYWKVGMGEMLSDLGYLWDNPMKKMTTRTFAHNTVLIDEQDQVAEQRGGEVEFFKCQEHVKAMRASSHAYAQAKLYERTSLIVDHGSGKNYVVDVFRVQGGKVQDYVFHGPALELGITDSAAKASEERLYDFARVRELTEANAWRLDWKMNGATEFSAWALPENGERAFVGDGWGQRDSFNADRGRLVPYIVRREMGDGLHTFVSVFEGHAAGHAVVKGVMREPIAGGVRITVETDEGRDVVECLEKTVSVRSAAGKWEFDSN